MALRKPAIVIPNINLATSIQGLQWHDLSCELITPMYGGGVEAATVGTNMPIRASAIRGQLRFWWRLLAKHSNQEIWQNLDSDKKISQAESQLWGGAGDEVNASLVFLKVTDIQKLDVRPWAVYEPDHKGGFKTIPTAEKWANVPYVLFPAQGKKPGSADSKAPDQLAKPGLTWTLKIAFDENAKKESKDANNKVIKNEKGESLKEKALTDLQKKQAWQAIRWWASFGGVGARTRRGLGAVKVTGSAQIMPISLQEAKNIGCQLILRPSNSANSAWTDAVNKLRDFRQGHTVGIKKIEVGRNKGTESNRPGRSRWSEPDAIRFHREQSLPKHAQRVTLGNFFPRAAFGLPIIFKFKDDGNQRNTEPAQTSLQPIVGGNVEQRMASPLILRPYFDGKNWQAAALLLPYEHVNNLQLDLSGTPVTYWNTVQAEHVRPIRENNGTDALSAFMNFFAE